MAVSRRKFLSTAVCSAALSLVNKGWASFSWQRRQDLDCLIVDLQEQCALQESGRGYESALAATGVGFARALSGATLKCRNVIVPAAAQIGEGLAHKLLTFL